MANSTDNINKYSPFVSVCVPTVGRGIILCNTVEYLLGQNYDNYEIIIADQTINHDAETEDYLEKVNDRIRYYKLAEQSLTKARNYCIKKANGEILIFIDDDVSLEKNFIYYHARNYIDETIFSVGGPVIEDERKKVPRITANPLTIMGRPVLNRSSNIRGQIKGWCGGNMSFRASVFPIVGYFDEKLPKPWWREETDIFFRMRQKSLKVIYDPDASLNHLRAREGGSQADRKFGDNPSLNIDVFASETIFHLKFYSKFTLPLTIVFQFFWLGLKFNFKNPINLLKSTILMIKGFKKGYKYFVTNY